MINKNKKTYLYIGLGAVIFVAFVWLMAILWDVIITQKVITLEPASGTTITLGTQEGDTPAIKDQIAKTTTKLSKRLRPGAYIVIFSGKGYEDQSQAIDLNDNVSIKTPKLLFTDEKLAEALTKEKNKLHEVVFRHINNDKYSIIGEGLYQRADWYVVAARSKSDDLDDLRLVLRKDSGEWKVAAGVSSVLWIDNYPDVPQEIIRAANIIGFNPT
jgi:ethanolamine utilization protein EutP (predicted NTPase)